VRRHRRGWILHRGGRGGENPPVQEQRLRPTEPLDLALTLGPLQRGRYDPCTRVTSREVWRATRTPDGDASMCIARLGDEVVPKAAEIG